MKIRRIITFIFAIFLFQILALIWQAVDLTQTNTKIAQAKQDHYKGLEWAQHLQQSSDNLTRMVRSYAVTSDPRYKTYFLEVQGIRNGSHPRPDNYSASYWDHRIATEINNSPLPQQLHPEMKPSRKGASFDILLLESGISSLQWDKLKQAKNISDDLVILEIEAMRSLEGGNRKKALTLLFGQQYYRQKSTIMGLIDEFSTLTHKATSSTITHLEQQQRNTLNIIKILTATLVATIAFAFFLMMRFIVKPINNLSEHCNKDVKHTDNQQKFKGSEIANIGSYIKNINIENQQETEHREKNEHLLLSMKLKAKMATKAKADFLSNMSHQIRTPLNAMIGMSYLALKTDLNSKQKNFISKSHHSGKRLLKIINDILDYSKIESDSLQLEKRPFYLSDLLETSLSLVSADAYDKRLELALDVSDNLPERLVGDKLRLEQILVNLMSNAITFTDTGEVVLGVYSRKSEGATIELEFIVTDSGVGIDENRQHDLFDAFHLYDQSISDRPHGAGIGLPISQMICRAHGGEIKVESTLGIGSTFSFSVSLPTLNQIAAEANSDINLTGKRVLLVEDHSISREIITSQVISLGCEVSIAHNGREALDLLEEQVFDLVLSDWQMPVMDGIELARNIHGCTPLLHKPAIILMTAYNREDAIQSAGETVIDCFLDKPMTPTLLRNAISSTLEKSPQHKTEDPLKRWYKYLRGKSILLVDDDDLNRELASLLLQDADINVIEAENGQQALDILNSNVVDGILTDIHMPKLDGYSTCRKIRTDRKLVKLPIIGMTASASSHEKQAARESGMDDLIAKPFEIDQLYQTLAQHLDKKAG